MSLSLPVFIPLRLSAHRICMYVCPTVYLSIYISLTMSPGAITSGLIRPSSDKPRALKYATVSMSVTRFVPSVMSPSEPVRVMRVPPEVLAPTARTFFVSAGLPIVQVSRSKSPSLPAANISRFSGFCTQGREGKRGSGVSEEPIRFRGFVPRGWKGIKGGERGSTDFVEYCTKAVRESEGGGGGANRFWGVLYTRRRGRERGEGGRGIIAWYNHLPALYGSINSNDRQYYSGLTTKQTKSIHELNLTKLN